MALYQLRGRDARGRPLHVRLEAASRALIEGWLARRGVQIESLRRWPLTWGPYSRFPGLILGWPVLVLLLAMSLVSVASQSRRVAETVGLSRLIRTLEREGQRAAGRLTPSPPEWDDPSDSNTLGGYVCEIGGGITLTGTLGPGRTATLRHYFNAELLGFGPLAPDGPMECAYLPRRPGDHAPRPVEVDVLETLKAYRWKAVRRAGLALAIAAVSALLIYNILLRTGAMFEHARGGILEYARATGTDAFATHDADEKGERE